jgi:phosphonate transport system substrate-binding protein
MFKKWAVTLLTLLMTFAVASLAVADDCKNRGALDKMYCDESGDLTADAPKDKSKWKNPSTLVFTYTPVEDPAVYKDAFADFQSFLSKKTGKKVIYYTVHSNSAEVEAMRSGRLHIAGFSTGSSCFAVNLAGYVPIAVKGYEKEFQGYRLIVVVKKDSPFQKLSDLKGNKVAHSSPSSNSGHLAPLALFPKDGLTPGKDYEIVFSGKHDQSIMGVGHGDYDAGCVASDVFNRMAVAGRINKDDYRIIWQSSLFPTSSFGYAYDLDPELVKKIKEAFFEYRFNPEMQKTFGGADRFFPVTFKQDFELIRLIAESSGETFDEAGFSKMAEAEKRAADAKRSREANTPVPSKK